MIDKIKQKIHKNIQKKACKIQNVMDKIHLNLVFYQKWSYIYVLDTYMNSF